MTDRNIRMDLPADHEDRAAPVQSRPPQPMLRPDHNGTRMRGPFLLLGQVG